MIKKYLVNIKRVTIACAISIMTYVLIALLTASFFDEASKPIYLLAMSIYSIVLMSVFNLVLIHLTYIKNSSGEENAQHDFKDGYWGFKKDIIFLFKQELPMLITFALINSASWIIILIEKLIFSTRIISAVLLLYAPLNIVGTILPTWLNSILGYLFGTVLCFAIYLLELVMFRKKWYTYMFE